MIGAITTAASFDLPEQPDFDYEIEGMGLPHLGIGIGDEFTTTGAPSPGGRMSTTLRVVRRRGLDRYCVKIVGILQEHDLRDWLG